MKSLTAFIVLIYFISLPSYCQGEIDEEDKIFYRSERTYALTLSSLGLGGGYRYAKRITGFSKTIYLVEYSQLKHQKEIKTQSPNTQKIGGSFVYGKLNALGTLRSGVGVQKELFQKRDKGGISIRYMYSGGLSLGFQKPVYYVLADTNIVNYDRSRFTNAEEIKITSIERRLPFYVGFSEMKVVPGIYAKLGFSFEFSKSDAIFNAIETGIIVDAFYRKIPIMANDLNHWLYPAFYLSYRFGRVVDTQFKTKLNKVDKALVK